ncbi:MAG: single-stranded DNA-binding protein [Chloroflexota bacterium]|nr:single-stranded DNA-binding protein [Chloroflexota bacterium]
MQKMILIGNLGKDPEMTYTPEGTPVTKFPVAVSRTTKSPDGERKSETEWFNIVAWRNQAEICNQYLHKGNKVYIEGRLSQRRYTDKNGQERTWVEVIVNDMEMLTPKQQTSGPGDFSAPAGGDFLDDIDDSQPF